MQVVGFDIVVDPYHVWMIQSGEYLRLGGETRFRPVMLRREDFDRDIPVQPAVPASQYQPERALSEDRAQLVAW